MVIYTSKGTILIKTSNPTRFYSENRIVLIEVVLKSPLKNLKSVTIKNKWRMEIRLESGSFGDVYVGTDIETEKLVAIKLESEHADSKQVH